MERSKGHKAVPNTKPCATKHASTNCCAIVRNSSATAITTNATASAIDARTIASASTIATNAANAANATNATNVFVVKVHGDGLANEHAPHAGVSSGGSSVPGERRFSLSFGDAFIVFDDQSDRSSGHAM